MVNAASGDDRDPASVSAPPHRGPARRPAVPVCRWARLSVIPCVDRHHASIQSKQDV